MTHPHTPLYVALIHPIVLAAAALVWPGLSWRGRLLRLVLSLPFLVLLEALEVPLVLASSINDLLTYSLNPRADAASALIDWVHVLDGGGRFALAIAAALGVGGVQGRLVGRRSGMPEAGGRPARLIRPESGWTVGRLSSRHVGLKPDLHRDDSGPDKWFAMAFLMVREAPWGSGEGTGWPVRLPVRGRKRPCRCAASW